MLRALRSHPDRVHLGLMLALTFSTGIADAVGYLGLDRVFTANMTGNVVILGMALTGAANLPVIGPIIALVCFMAGAVIAGRTLRPVPAGWSHRSTALFTAVGVVLLATGVIVVLVGPLADAPRYVVTGALAVAMGMQAGSARHIGVKDVTTVVVTSTIVGLAFESRLAGGRGQTWFRRLNAIVLIAAGAAVGALLLHVHLGAGMLAAGVITIAAAVVGHIARPRPAASGAP